MVGHGLWAAREGYRPRSGKGGKQRPDRCVRGSKAVRGDHGQREPSSGAGVFPEGTGVVSGWGGPLETQPQ